MIPKACKPLAEVDFAIAEVSWHAAREKSEVDPENWTSSLARILLLN